MPLSEERPERGAGLESVSETGFPIACDREMLTYLEIFINHSLLKNHA